MQVIREYLDGVADAEAVEVVAVLVDVAAHSDGCAGARMMGGGFGGCTINLVKATGVDCFLDHASSEFECRFDRTPDAHIFHLVGGAYVHG